MSPEEYERQDIEVLNEVRPYCFESDREEQWFKVGLQYGLDAADKEPLIHWISVNDDLPCNHEDLLENEHYTKYVLAVLEWNDDPSKKHIEVCDMCNKIGLFNVDFYWRKSGYYTVTHWMRLPELPKE